MVVLVVVVVVAPGIGTLLVNRSHHICISFLPLQQCAGELAFSYSRTVGDAVGQHESCRRRLGPRRVNSGSGGRSAAYGALDLLPESLVQQSVHKRVDGRIEHDQRIRNGVHGGTEAVGFEVAHNIDNRVSNPANAKDDTYNNDSQCYSLPYL